MFWQQILDLLPNTSSLNPSFCVALSGGLDSIVLLHLLATNPQTKNLRALHIDHQLQESSTSWGAFCQNICNELHIPCQIIQVDLKNQKKMGVEAAARQARYDAFQENLRKDEILITAHHLDDQIETVFLRLFRGSGVEGIAAMKPCAQICDFLLLRPLLDVSRDEILNYAAQQNLQWIDDPSNAETQFDRNYLRHEIMPMIEKRWPAYRKTVQRFSHNAKSASTVLDHYIEQDYKKCVNLDENALCIVHLKTLSDEIQKLVIRFWMKENKLLMPGHAILQQVKKLIYADNDAQPLVEWRDIQLRRFRSKMYITHHTNVNFSKLTHQWDLKRDISLQGLGILTTKECLGQGLKIECLELDVIVRFRQDGEKCRPQGRHGSHSLKKLFQEYNVPPWQRDKIPIIVINNEIAAVLGLFYCSPFAAEKDEKGITIQLLLEVTTGIATY